MTFPLVETPEQTISISIDEYEQLLDDHNFLQCLKGCGVDNWDGYADAWVMHKETEDE
ncbi:MAG: hypothetical protein ACRDCE_08700 [Cetobacterium sp.]|uniref:hypothetical protein n=1 Tax=Cetobacterium sp. TaxID=2071632 RepID=UPI003EE7122E